MPQSGRLTNERLEEIERTAETALSLGEARLAELGLPYSGYLDVPLVAGLLTGGPVEAVRNLTRDGERLAGCIESSGPMPRLEFEAHDPPVRQRFSIAHELGHFFLHRVRELPRRCTERDVDPAGAFGPEIQPDEDEASWLVAEPPDVSGNGAGTGAKLAAARPLAEVEADAFAAAFLVPASGIRQDLEHFGVSVPFLAERYGVAEATLRRRLRTLSHLQGVPLVLTGVDAPPVTVSERA